MDNLEELYAEPRSGVYFKRKNERDRRERLFLALSTRFPRGIYDLFGLA